MVKDVLRYYLAVAWSQRKYSLTPVILSPFARIGLDYITPLIVATIIDRISSPDRPPFRSLGWLLTAFFAAPFIAELLWRLMQWTMNRSDAYAMDKIANDTFRDLMSRSYNFHVNNFSGSLVAKVNRFVTSYETLYGVFVYEGLGVLAGIVFATVVLFNESWQVGIIFSVVLVIFVGLMYRLTRKKFILNSERAAQESLQTGQLADSLTNAITTKTFAKEKHEQKQFSKVSKKLMAMRIRSWDYQNFPLDALTSNVVVGLNTIAIVGAVIAVYRYGATIGTVFLLLTYVTTLTNRFSGFSRTMRNIENALSNAVEMMRILKQEHTVIDESSAKTLASVTGNIEIRDVSFSYNKGGESNLFEKLNLSINAGQSIGLVGPSGGGKTTITKLLLRFMDIRSGVIEIDGQDISTVTQTSLRDAITYVPQEPLLFHRTLKENISYGKPGASMKEIIAAAKKANAHGFIEKLPKSYETLVGERGIKLSGGQRQRVALARAILKDAPIIVLDEATSALDSESEKLIQQALFTLMEGRTSIVIAHRLSTVKHLDRILVLEDGMISEDGSHADLIKKKNGTYARLWSHQSGGFIE